MPLTQVQGGMLAGSTNTTTTIQSNGTTAITIDSSQNVGIGTSSPAGKLDVRGAGYFIGNGSIVTTFWGTSANINDGSGYCQWNTSETAFKLGAYTSNPCVFVTGNTERMRIDSAGFVGIGSSSPSSILHVNAGSGIATSGVIARFFGTSGNSLLIRGNGNAENTNGSYGAISDAKLKENIVDATPKLNKVTQLKVRNYNLIGDELKQIGFVAQEIEQVFPSIVSEIPDLDEKGNDLGTTTKTVKTTVLIPILVKAIQELNAKVEAQAAEIAALKATP